MRLAIQHHLVPGGSLAEQFERAAEFGLDGIELTAWGLKRPFFEEHGSIAGAMLASGLPVASLCTRREDDFVHPDPQERAVRFKKLVALLRFADTIRAAGLIGLPIRQPLVMPDSPVMDSSTVTTELTVEALCEAIAETQGVRARIFLEPLNRYETKYLNTVGHAADLCRRVGSPRVQVMPDLYHMNIEEADPSDSLRQAAEHVGHVHLADSNRCLPGNGHTDFLSPLRALAQAQFDGWFALECTVTGDPTATIPAAVRFLRRCWSEARETAHA